MRKLNLMVSLLLLATMVLAACGPAATEQVAQPPAPTAAEQVAQPAEPTKAPEPTAVPPTPEPAAEKTLVIAMGADATYLDPESVMNNESGFVMSAIFDGLTKYKKGTSEPGPGLAEKWDISAEGKEYTFYLRKGVKFHDGTDWNADALMFELDRNINENNEYYIYKQEGVHSFSDFTWGIVESSKRSTTTRSRSRWQNPTHRSWPASPWSGRGS